MKVTVKDVAKQAKTSVATVSRVINNSGFVSPDLKKRVIKVINELEYHPNAIAKSLKKDKTNMIGLLISDITNPFFSAIVRGVEDTVYKEGFTVFLCNTDKDKNKENKYIMQLLEKQVEGLIISAATSDADNFRILIDRKIPLVFVNRAPENLQVDAVINNNEYGGYIATKHLIELNHKKIATIVGPNDINTGYERKNGYIKALEEFGIKINTNFIKIGDFSMESGYKAVKELLRLKMLPTAIFIANNEMALGAVKALKEEKVKIPEDISIVGFDSSAWMEVVEPKIATVNQHSYELGHQSANYLLKRILGKGDYAENIIKVLEPDFVIGNSTRKLY